MTKVMSTRQLVANRRNAKHSTGPRTPRSKAAIAKNNLRHGLLSREIILSSPNAPESRADFDQLLADLTNQLKPQNIIEQTLVERIATCYWRLRRAQRFESGAIRASFADSVEAAVNLHKLACRITETQASLDRAIRLQQIMQKPEESVTDEELTFLQTAMPEFKQENRLFLTVSLTGPRSPGAQLRSKVLHFIEEVVGSNQALLSRLHKQYDAALFEDAARRAVQPKAVSLPVNDSIVRVIRYETMLDRQIHRALAQLRRLRDPKHPLDSAQQ